MALDRGFIDAGDLQHRVTLQSPGGVRDSVGQRQTVWKDVKTVWASIEPLSAREQFIARELQASTTHTVTIRWSPDVSGLLASWRVKYGNRYFVIDGQPRNINERNVMLELTCTEGLRDE